MPHSLKKVIEVLKCPRAHVAKRHLRLPDPKSPWLQFGIDFHAVCEGYLRTGQLGSYTGGRAGEFALIDPESQIGRLARRALTRAPAGALPEVDLTFAFAGRDGLQAHLDWIAPDWSEFGDWKSSGGKGELTDETLHDDVQANWQAHGFLAATGRTEVRGRWTYVDKSTEAVREAVGDFTIAATTAYLDRIVVPAFRVIELYEYAQPTDLHSVPHDPLDCSRGRKNWCPFLSRCQMRASTGPTLVQLRRAAESKTQ